MFTRVLYTAALLALGPGVVGDLHAQESTYRLDRTRDAFVLATTAAGLLLTETLGGDRSPLEVDDLGRFSRDDVPWFDRAATRRRSPDLARMSRGLAVPLVLAPTGLLADERVRSEPMAFGVMYAQTALLSVAVPGAAKAAVWRHRPYVYNTDLDDDQRLERDPGRSFFSRTTTVSVAHAVFLATVFGDHRPESAFRPWVWSAALAAGGTVGWLRVQAGEHYLSDVLVGAGVGAGIGYLVPRMHRVGYVGPELDARADGNGGVTVSVRFAF